MFQDDLVWLVLDYLRHLLCSPGWLQTYALPSEYWDHRCALLHSAKGKWREGESRCGGREREREEGREGLRGGGKTVLLLA